MLDLRRDNASHNAIRENRKESGDFSNEMTVEQAHTLATKMKYHGSQLTSEQRRAILMRTFAWHLKDNGLRSPQYYAEKSQCLSVAEAAWPGAIGYVKADRLKRGYIEPEDLIARLHRLKPSDNFELHKYRYPPIDIEKSPLDEEAITISTPEPDWLLHHSSFQLTKATVDGDCLPSYGDNESEILEQSYSCLYNLVLRSTVLVCLAEPQSWGYDAMTRPSFKAPFIISVFKLDK